MKKLLYQIHRWAGIALALFMTIWFTSGLVIMYSGPSALERAEQLAHRETLEPASGWLSLGEAWRLSAGQRAQLPEVKPREEAGRQPATPAAEGQRPKGQPQERIAEARLVRQADQPLWLVENGQGQRFALSATDGSVHQTSVPEAARIALQWIRHDEEAAKKADPGNDVAIQHIDTGPQDSSVRNQEALSPFHRFNVGDSGRELLISARTGEVVRDSTPFTRALYWTGNWIHLMRPVEAISTANTRRQVLTWLSFFAVGASLTGLIIGWQRWRPGIGGRPTYSQGRVHPYRDVWNTWHFWVGLIGGTAALLWALSGYFNNNPGQIFSPATASRAELGRYHGSKAPEAILAWRPQPLANAADQGAVVELSWHRLGEQAALLGITRNGQRQAQAVAGTVARFGDQALLAAVGRLSQGVPVAAHALQTDYDSYYYPRHHQGLVDKPLPVLRVDLADAGATRLYLDPQDGRVLLKQDASRRAYRWLYSAVHHWDFGWLYHRPIWDAWMQPLVLMGVVLGGTSVVLGYKRLQLEYRTARKKAQKRQAALAKAAQAAKAGPKASPVVPPHVEVGPDLQSS